MGMSGQDNDLFCFKRFGQRFQCLQRVNIGQAYLHDQHFWCMRFDCSADLVSSFDAGYNVETVGFENMPETFGYDRMFIGNQNVNRH